MSDVDPMGMYGRERQGFKAAVAQRDTKIEALTVEVERLKASTTGHLLRKVDDLRDEVERLRNLLRLADENAERLENLVDVAEHNLHEAIADLKERDAGIARLRRQRNEARRRQVGGSDSVRSEPVNGKGA